MAPLEEFNKVLDRNLRQRNQFGGTVRDRLTFAP